MNAKSIPRARQKIDVHAPVNALIAVLVKKKRWKVFVTAWIVSNTSADCPARRAERSFDRKLSVSSRSITSMKVTSVDMPKKVATDARLAPANWRVQVSSSSVPSSTAVRLNP